MGKLVNLKLFDVGESAQFSNITDDICKWKQLRYFRMITTSIPMLPDCIGDSWTPMRRIELFATPKLTYVPKSVFQLPQLITFYAIFSGIRYDAFSFDTNDKFGSNLKRVFLQQTKSVSNAICNNYDKLSNKTIEFIDKYNACDITCNLTYDCTPNDIMDGVCDDACNIESCQWDKGDCNQLRLCNYTLWNNGICDDECNNYNCNYDFGDCLINSTNSTVNVTDDSGYCYIDTTSTDMNDTSLITQCPNSWLHDQWCDGDCEMNNYHNGSCIDESQDCSSCIKQCYESWYILISNVAAQEAQGIGDSE